MTMNRLVIMGGGIILAFVALVLWDLQKSRHQGTSSQNASKKKYHPLQTFLPIDGFDDESDAIRYRTKLKRILRVDNLNLNSMSAQEIEIQRNRFRDMMVRLSHPFQISMQARRANYTDYMNYVHDRIQPTLQEERDKGNTAFVAYGEQFMRYLGEEVKKPRSDRENAFVVSVPSKVGEKKEAHIERLEREVSYVEEGFESMKIPYLSLNRILTAELIQNFWNRDRAMSQRYRDAFRNFVHTPTVHGASTISDEDMRKEEINHA
ncbi:hypothetical protein MM817_03238 [Acidibacillus sp. S0AB]|uniref:Uncharacterized protein n=2 Tax=Sulfoacidibacillus ferrooxidans TaxID=2005001 RepID=A0A9X1VAY5_9BACL|nr:hypothetical protein [Sulfoacidibacillus ferrooxidans]